MVEQERDQTFAEQREVLLRVELFGFLTSQLDDFVRTKRGSRGQGHREIVPETKVSDWVGSAEVRAG